MRYLSLLVLVLLAACTEPSAPEESRTSVIGDPLLQAVDRAESVQNTLDEQAAQMRSRIEAAENGNQ